MLFLWGRNATRQDALQFSWRYECVHVLLWALGFVPELNPAHVVADVAQEAALLATLRPAGLAQQAKLRPPGELLDQADLYYRLDWAATQLRLKGEPHDKINGSVIRERRRALEWLIGPRDRAWDDVRLDT
jgi:hypothetical protein